ncbi:hypothetical protein ACRALDRAFT_213313 [Sodiomyces alcalophilus JCM 7366]|uniref:uncharacterized protein n=1 Tax=Sodiomyces alcalophilus JCM 7366 TaxID=591952 RepID=UPI0039B3BE8F
MRLQCANPFEDVNLQSRVASQDKLLAKLQYHHRPPFQLPIWVLNDLGIQFSGKPLMTISSYLGSVFDTHITLNNIKPSLPGTLAEFGEVSNKDRASVLVRVEYLPREAGFYHQYLPYLYSPQFLFPPSLPLPLPLYFLLFLFFLPSFVRSIITDESVGVQVQAEIENMTQTSYSFEGAAQAPTNMGLGSEARVDPKLSHTINSEDAPLYYILKAAMEADCVEQKNIASAVDDNLSRATQSPASTPTTCSGAATPVGRPLIPSPFAISTPMEQFWKPDDLSYTPIVDAFRSTAFTTPSNQITTTPDVATSSLPSREEMTMDLSFEDVTFAKQPGEIFDEEEETPNPAKLPEGGVVTNCDFALGPAPPSRAFSSRFAPTPSKGRNNANINDGKESGSSRHSNTFPGPYSGLPTQPQNPRGVRPTEPTDNQAVLAAIPLPEIAQAIRSRGFIVLPRDATDDFLASQGLTRTSHLSEGELARLGIPQPRATPASSLSTTTAGISVPPGHVQNVSNSSSSNDGGIVLDGGSCTSMGNNSASPSSLHKRNVSVASLPQAPSLARQTSKKRKSSKTSTLDITGRPDGFPAPSGLSNAIMDSILRQQEAKRNRI